MARQINTHDTASKPIKRVETDIIRQGVPNVDNTFIYSPAKDRRLSWLGWLDELVCPPKDGGGRKLNSRLLSRESNGLTTGLPSRRVAATLQEMFCPVDCARRSSQTWLKVIWCKIDTFVSQICAVVKVYIWSPGTLKNFGALL